MGLIIGSDSRSPILETGKRKRIFFSDEVYLGEEGDGKYVLRVNELVIYPDGGIKRAAAVDIAGIPTLRPFCFKSCADALSDAGDFYPGGHTGVFKARINRSTYPMSITIDTRYLVSGRTTSYAKIFFGSESDNDDKLIGFMETSATGDKTFEIPLELAVLPDVKNVTMKRVLPCKTQAALQTGDYITVAVYDQDGVLGNTELMQVVEQYSAQVDAHSAPKVVNGIYLVGDYVSNAERNVVRVPSGIDIRTMSFYACASYTDGSVSRPTPVTGNPFTLEGIDDYSANVLGEVFEFALTYRLQTNETAVVPFNPASMTIVTPVKVDIILNNLLYDTRLYPFLDYIDDNNGYELRWWLIGRQSRISMDVTNKVHLSDGETFNRRSMNVEQHLTPALNLNEVAPTFAPTVVVQSSTVIVRNTPFVNDTGWSAVPQTSKGIADDYVGYGTIVTGYNGVVDFGTGLTAAEWKIKYFNTATLIESYEGERENMLLTEVIVSYRGTVIRIDADDIDKPIQIGVSVASGSTVVISYVAEISGIPSIVGMTPFVVI